MSPDDLTTLVGIGPKLAAALAERGVTTYAHLAAWTTDQAEAFDAELSLKGRVARDAWVAQAKRLRGGLDPDSSSSQALREYLGVVGAELGGLAADGGRGL